MKKAGLIILIIIAAYYSLYAEYMLNFYTGDVYIETDNKKIMPQLGMVLAGESEIITGQKGFAAVYDSSRNAVIRIQSGIRIKIASINKSKNVKTGYSIFEKFKKENPVFRTEVVAVMGMSVDESGEKFKKLRYNQSPEWILYLRKKYDLAAEKTKGDSNVDSRFIRGASLYYMSGIKNSKESIEELESVLKHKSYEELFPETHRILANIYFELGRYDLSYLHISSFVKNEPENEISETSYYIMIVSSINTGKVKEARSYAVKMKKYHPKSVLLGETGL